MRKTKYNKPFIGMDIIDNLTLQYAANGNYSVILQIKNPILQYAADPDQYDKYHDMYGQIIKSLGTGHIVQKTDIIAKKAYHPTENLPDDYLSQKFFEHFKGRHYNHITTYLTITRETNKSRFFTYNKAGVTHFCNRIYKIIDIISSRNVPVEALKEKDILKLHSRFTAFNFNDKIYSMNNMDAGDDGIRFGEGKMVKVMSLIDIEEQNLPNSIPTFSVKPELSKNFPVDKFSWLFGVEDAEAILYNQTFFIPDQIKLKRSLDSKKKRHSSMPDREQNDLSVKDIEDAFVDIAANNEILVYCHFDMLVYTDEEYMSKAVNQIENGLFNLGIIPSKSAYNQMELFQAAIPGNAGELQEYDKFLTSRPAAVSFILNERLPEDEVSDYLHYYTDRQGIPTGIDTSELPMSTGRITNRNKFVLGPSGTGKSFWTNNYIRQCLMHGADVVVVDTGHSYLGTCKYYNGKYITYQEDKPITMNPFKIEEVEYNVEKKDMLKSLIGLLWKGVNGEMNQTEESVISDVITAYYTKYFAFINNPEKGAKIYRNEDPELEHFCFTAMCAKEDVSADKIKALIASERIEQDAEVFKRQSLQGLPELSFNSFYEYSVDEIKRIKEQEDIEFDYNNYRYILKKFYRGGEYETILNDDYDSTLFNEKFIVFEVDTIKENKILFPITTLIIMDVFIQKMRHKSNKKILVIEEAWKAIASPMMAVYILYLYKTVRKFKGEAMVVTQELNDIVGNEVVKDSILVNSDTICLLDQSKFKNDFDNIEKLLGIDEVEKNKIFTVNRLDNRANRSDFKEVYIKRGQVGEVYGVEVSLEEYLTYTTELSEREVLEYYLETYSDYQTAMDTLVQDFKRSKLSKLQFIQSVNRKISMHETVVK